jgi:hypothetical protein
MRPTFDIKGWWRGAAQAVYRLLAGPRRSTAGGLADETEWAQAAWLAVSIAMIGLCLGSVFALSPHELF